MQAQAGNAVQWGNVAQWVSGVATSLAVIVALFKEDYIRWRRHPKLTASIEAKYPDCVRTPAAWRGVNKEKPWKGWRYWLRVWVKNEGNVRAEKVEVFLSRAWVMQNNGVFEPLTNFSPDMRRLCDFGSILEPAYSDPANPSLSETRLSLRLQVPPATTDWLPPGRYKFEIATYHPKHTQSVVARIGQLESPTRVLIN
jgi:hypothetical protein